MAPIPVLLLKTKSVPDDSYEEQFSASDSDFSPIFVPVLEHRPNAQSLGRMKKLLVDKRLNEEYGGMIFTSQRAVEAFAAVVDEIEQPGSQNDTKLGPTSPTSFPLYTVGPATSRALNTLLSTSLSRARSVLAPLSCTILGAHTGNGETLARYMLHDYNALHRGNVFALYEAPRLPFVPLVGNRSEQYPRLERSDVKLQKKPLLFLVGEQRQDVIPRRLMDGALGERRIEVEEMVVYSTQVMANFEVDFRKQIERASHRQIAVVAVVVFSPSGCEAMLKVLGLIDDKKDVTEGARREGQVTGGGTVDDVVKKYVIVTIGPTTRDYLKDEFGFEADICASKPSPEGVVEDLRAFLTNRGLLRRGS